tara:strand:- start:5572 stop:5712 length:141 start_codon:yes stop_codon:yes gene_type:complete
MNSDEEEIDLGINEEEMELLEERYKPKSFRARICQKLIYIFIKKRK